MIDKNKKTIVFDFGNILINLDYEKCFSAFRAVLGVDFSEGLPEKTKAHLFKYDRGKLNTEGFLWHLQQYNPQAEIRTIIAAWNALLGELPLSRFEMIASLRKDYNVCMLSNINEMHIEKIHRDLVKNYGIDDFHSLYFDKVYYSCRMGMRKPDREIYDFVSKDLDQPPADLFFIDDMEENITACRAAGWNGIRHNPNEDIINNIDSYLSKQEEKWAS